MRIQSSCVDVQHKKRGRPRLREEESSRGLAFRTDYPPEELYSIPNGVLAPSESQRHRSKTYRELRSQPESTYGEQRPRTSDSSISQQQYMRGAAGYGSSIGGPAFISDHVPTAILTTDFVVTQHNRALSDALSLSFTARGQSLSDLVVPAERERIRRLQASIQSELREALHAAYVNGGSNPHASIPAIEHIDLARVTAGYRMRSEYWTFRLPREQSIGFPISVSLARDGAHFVILTLVQSTTPLQSIQSPPLRQDFRTQPIMNTGPASHLTPSPPKSAHSSHSGSHQRGAMSDPYAMSVTSPTSVSDQYLAMQTAGALAQYRQVSPPRSVQQLPYNATRTDSSGSTSSIPRSSPSSSNQPISSRDLLRDLQLPPIRTTPTSNPVARHEEVSTPRRRYQSGTPSPSRSSTHSASKRKKRRRVEIGDLMH